MCGFNKQEGASAMLSLTFANKTQESVANGTSQRYVHLTLIDLCKKTTPLSIDLCVDLLQKTYGLDSIVGDKERGVQLSHIYGTYV